MTVTAEELAVRRKQRLRLVAERKERLLGAHATAGLDEGGDFVGGQGVGARLAGVATEGAVAAVVPAQRGERDEHLGRERDGSTAPAIAGFPGSGEKIGKPLGRRLDEGTGPGVADHRRRDDEAGAVRVARARRRPTFGRTSWAKRSRLASTARRSWVVASNTKWLTPSAW